MSGFLDRVRTPEARGKGLAIAPNLISETVQKRATEAVERTYFLGRETHGELGDRGAFLYGNRNAKCATCGAEEPVQVLVAEIIVRRDWRHARKIQQCQGACLAAQVANP